MAERDAAASSAARDIEQDAKSYWFMYGTDESIRRFRERGVWENAYDEKSNIVRRIRPGDKIAIHTRFNKKKGLPFEAGGKFAAGMRIKATGTVLDNAGDGRTVNVTWDGPAKPREWYFYVYIKEPIVQANLDDKDCRRLIDFAFRGASQDYALFLAMPYWRNKYHENRTAVP